jgi:hypothetical protein
MNSGGNACPATYRWLLLNEKGFEASPDFGNCSEEAKGSLVGNELIVMAPKYGTPPYGVPGAKYTFNGIQMKENDKVKPEKVLVGKYSGGQVEAGASKLANQESKSSQRDIQKYYERGICAQAVWISADKGDLPGFVKKYAGKIDADEKILHQSVSSTCPSRSESCMKTLPLTVQAFLSGAVKAKAELSSPAPTSLINTRPIGNSEATLSVVMRGYCAGGYGDN